MTRWSRLTMTVILLPMIWQPLWLEKPTARNPEPRSRQISGKLSVGNWFSWVSQLSLHLSYHNCCNQNILRPWQLNMYFRIPRAFSNVCPKHPYVGGCRSLTSPTCHVTLSLGDKIQQNKHRLPKPIVLTFIPMLQVLVDCVVELSNDLRTVFTICFNNVVSIRFAGRVLHTVTTYSNCKQQGNPIEKLWWQQHTICAKHQQLEDSNLCPIRSCQWQWRKCQNLWLVKVLYIWWAIITLQLDSLNIA